MIYELRIYHAMPGKLPALLERFTTITCRKFEEHGIEVIGYWTTVIGESNQQLIYLCQYEDLSARERAWSAFSADPEWQQKRAESERDGPLVHHVTNMILRPTGFSPLQ
jgi:hypothetical protein